MASETFFLGEEGPALLPMVCSECGYVGGVVSEGRPPSALKMLVSGTTLPRSPHPHSLQHAACRILHPNVTSLLGSTSLMETGDSLQHEQANNGY